MKRLFAAALIAVGSTAFAQSQPALIEDARRVGREASAPGLEEILRSKDVARIEAYARGLGETGSRQFSERGYKAVPLPADVEAVVTRYYGDPDLAPRLANFCGSNGMTCATDELFDLMFATLRAQGQRYSTYLRDAVIKSTAPKAEPALVTWLGSADGPTSDVSNALINELSFRKSVRAVPVLAARLSKAPPGKGGYELEALGRIGDSTAVEALLGRLQALGPLPRTEETAAEAQRIASQLHQLPATVPLSYARLGRLLPSDPGLALKWLSERKDIAAVPDVLALLPVQARRWAAVQALIASDSPETWKQAREGLEKEKREGRIAENEFGMQAGMLDAKIADPGKHFAEQRQGARARVLQERSSNLGAAYYTSRKLIASDPAEYVKAAGEYYAALEKLVDEYQDIPGIAGTTSTLNQGYLDLGHFVRFRARDPRQALKFYAKALERKHAFAGVAIADTWQFDLRDGKRALQEYRNLVDATPAPVYGRDEVAAFKAWGQRWIAAQIDFLANGRKFSGSISTEEVSVLMMMAAGGMGGGDDDAFGIAKLAHAGPGAPPAQAEVKQALATIPASVFALQASIRLASYLPDVRAIRAYFDRMDPPGFVTATWFALLAEVERKAGAGPYGAYLAPGMSSSPSDPMRVARAQFMKERNIDTRAITEAGKPDPRMATPRQTWDLVMKSLRAGDLATLMACLTPEMQKQFHPMFSQMSAAEMRDAADELVEFQVTTGYGEFQEGLIGRKDGVAGSITFTKVGSNWKIVSM